MVCGRWSGRLLLAAAALAFGSPAGATSKRQPPPPVKSHAKKPLPKGCPVVKEEPPPPAPPPVAGNKVAVLDFTGDDAESVRRQVMHVLRARGMKVMTGLRPVDSAEQFRELSVAMSLVAYIDGEVAVDGRAASATIFVRNGLSGLRSLSTTFTGDRRQLGATIAKELWDRIGAAMGEACADAGKPHKLVREPMRINAGTPLTDADTAD
ncbi:MAG TPA: hypothetical protein VMT03_24140 [Polyangia bacterium]|nr:hypothetical protein [Polyangia bacterium]